jgi:hypothetical protein
LNGNGGTGICSTITGSRIFYAGGGGGGITSGGSTTSSVGIGASGGGNGGGNNDGFYATPGFANTGGGGGGGGSNYNVAYQASGAGGSGIVIIRYPQNLNAPASTTGNPQILYNNGFQIYIWTSSGSITF